MNICYRIGLLFLVVLAGPISKGIAQVSTYDWKYTDPAKYQIFQMTNDILYNMNRQSVSSSGYVAIVPGQIFDFKIKFIEDIKDRKAENRRADALKAERAALYEKGCIEGDCQNGYGEMFGGVLPGTSTLINYVGEFKNGKPHGEGTLDHHAWRYQGKFSEGKREGYGKIEYGSAVYPVGRYIGEWKADQKEGKGTFTEPDGLIYSGNWQKDKIINGIAVLPDSTSFEGEFEQIKGRNVTGFGTLTTKDGVRKKGLVKDGKMVYEANTKEEVPAQYKKAILPVYDLIYDLPCGRYKAGKYSYTQEKVEEVKDYDKKQLQEFEDRLKAGANPNEKYALHYAAWKRRVDLIKLLLAYGADPLLLDESGDLPIRGLISPYVICEEEALAALEALEILAKAGNPVNNEKTMFSEAWLNIFNLEWNYEAHSPLAEEWARKFIQMGVRFDIPNGYNNLTTLERCKDYNKALYKILKKVVG